MKGRSLLGIREWLVQSKRTAQSQTCRQTGVFCRSAAAKVANQQDLDLHLSSRRPVQSRLEFPNSADKVLRHKSKKGCGEGFQPAVVAWKGCTRSSGFRA